MIVLDASAAVAALVDENEGARARQRIVAAAQCHAPYLLDLEVANALRKLAARQRITEELAASGLEQFRRLDITRYPHEPFLTRIWELRHHLSSYDAAYVALAEALDAPLITFDARLADAPSHGCTIDLLA